MSGKMIGIVLIAGVVAMLSAGCSDTASLVPAFEETAATAPEPFIGRWTCELHSDVYDIQVLALRGKNVRIEITQLARGKDQNDFYARWVPLTGMFTQIRGRCFLTVTVDSAALRREVGRNSASSLFFQPCYYLLELTPDDRGVEVRPVTFGIPPESGNVWTAVNSGVRLHGRLVLNSSAEIQRLLAAGQYRPADEAFRLVRKVPAAVRR